MITNPSIAYHMLEIKYEKEAAVNVQSVLTKRLVYANIKIVSRA